MEQVIRCIAVDDELPALRIIEQYALQCTGLQLVAKFRNPTEAAAWLETNPCDLVFLDIQMPQQSGLTLLQNLRATPVVVFTTAYSEFAADAFDLDAADYLRKPFSAERFNRAVDKAKDYLQLAGKNIEKAEYGNDAEGFISIKADGRMVKVYFNEILYVEGFQEYIKIFTQKERFITYERMKNMEAMLPATQFMRVHKSYIVALKQVKAIAGNLLEVGENHIPVSRDLKEAVVKRVFY